MANKKGILLIVESQTKAKTIEKYLGNGYTVEASIGHLIDLPKSRLAVDVNNNFKPEYITVRGKAKILKNLAQKAKKAEKILLASDNDREGEAIAYHIKNALQKKNPQLKFERIVFNEITPDVIRDSVQKPRDIDEGLVNAQKARRILDRIVGYNLSPILWAKVKNGLSAGRVQSVALRLICEREKEVEDFIPEEYWTLKADLKKGKRGFQAQLTEYQGKKPELRSQKDVDKIIAKISGKDFTVADIKQSEKILKPKAPFTTSKLQQMAANRLGFISRKTMRIAQQLYEGVNIGAERIGLITYMRTDSTRISSMAMNQLRNYIGTHYPDDLTSHVVNYAVSKGAQDAHEAIRPTYVKYTPQQMMQYLSKDQYKLYAIIWEQFVACQMKPARSLTISYKFSVAEAVFKSNATKIVELGFYKVLKILAPKEKKQRLPILKIGEKVICSGFLPEQHFTSGPPRYTDASIIKALEENGIGRPSTYAPIISVLLDRYYVVRKNKQLKPTVLGKIINDILIKSFPHILDVNFTAQMENKLDQIEVHNQEWVKMLTDFYKPFKSKVEHVMDTLESIKGIMEEETDMICEKCGRKIVKKLGRYGFFLACTGFPDCKNTKPIPLADCPKDGCNGKIIARRRQGGKSREFYGCTNYPECDFICHIKPLSQNCPRCGKFMVEKEDKKRGNYKACIDPKCGYKHIQKYLKEEKGDKTRSA